MLPSDQHDLQGQKQDEHHDTPSQHAPVGGQTGDDRTATCHGAMVEPSPRSGQERWQAGASSPRPGLVRAAQAAIVALVILALAGGAALRWWEGPRRERDRALHTTREFALAFVVIPTGADSFFLRSSSSAVRATEGSWHDVCATTNLLIIVPHEHCATLHKREIVPYITASVHSFLSK